MWIGHCYFKQVNWLLSLAEEIGCDTDPDLVTAAVSGLSTNMAFIGKNKKCWVRYVNEAKIELIGITGNPNQTVDMTDPRCMERLEKWFHEDNT